MEGAIQSGRGPLSGQPKPAKGDQKTIREEKSPLIQAATSKDKVKTLLEDHLTQKTSVESSKVRDFELINSGSKDAPSWRSREARRLVDRGVQTVVNESLQDLTKLEEQGSLGRRSGSNEESSLLMDRLPNVADRTSSQLGSSQEPYMKIRKVEKYDTAFSANSLNKIGSQSRIAPPESGLENPWARNTCLILGESKYAKVYTVSNQTFLDLDGGGIRGYSRLLILRALMEQIGDLETQDDPSIQGSSHPLSPPSKIQNAISLGD